MSTVEVNRLEVPAASVPQPVGLGDVVTRGEGKVLYRVWLIDGDVAIATSQNTGIPRRVSLNSLRFVRHVENPDETGRAVFEDDGKLS